MTAEQIEELRRLTEEASSADTFCMMLPVDMTETDLRWLEAARNMLPRLLNERDRLLAALRNAVDEMGVAIGAPPMWTDAIAFAEADSDGH